MRFVTRALAVGIVLSPLFATAEGARVCTPPGSPIKYGISGDAVANLQIFLSRDKTVYPEGTVSGYFGPATERAVGRWQVKYGVLPEGTLREGGLGLVGPRTIAMIKKLWECDGPVSSSWFSAILNGGLASFSGQASSSYPLNPTLLYVDFGDGERGSAAVSSAVCRGISGPCSSVVSATHTYRAGSFTATLRAIHPTDRCAVFSPAWICAQAAKEDVLGTVKIVSNGAAPSQDAVRPPGVAASHDPLAPVTSLSVQASYHPAVSGSIALSGGSLTIRWTGTSTPLGTSAELLLYDAGNKPIGTITSDLNLLGSYWWSIPRRASGTCASDAITCLSRLAGMSCTGGICPLEDGTYAVVVRLRYSNSVVAAARLGTFSLGGGDIAILTAESQAATGTPDTISYGAYGTTPISAASMQGGSLRTCYYSGVQYGEGVTLNLNCADLAGGSCTQYGGAALTCRSGSWVNASGTPVLISGVTTSSSSNGSRCRTPWGSQTVESGNQITYEPFFTSGNYSGMQTIPLMQCTNGQWQKCDWQGANCKTYIPA